MTTRSTPAHPRRRSGAHRVGPRRSEVKGWGTREEALRLVAQAQERFRRQ